MVKYSIKVVVFCTITLTDAEGHLICLRVAFYVLLGVFLLSLGEWSDTAVDSDLTFKIFKLVKQLFTLSLLFFVLVADLIELSSAFFELRFDKHELLFERLGLACSFTELFSLLQ